MRRIRFGILSTLLALSAAAVAAPASVQDYPSKPIRLIVPFAAGGGNDGVARIVAQKLSQRLTQQVIVDNRGGAGGNIAADIAAHAAPDGYTLFLLNSANLIAPSLYEHITYDPIRDFAPVTMMVTSSFLIVAPIDSPLHTLGDLLIQARAHPGSITFASGGNGSATHLAAELFAHQAGVNLVHVPYKGAAPALIDLLAGRVSLYWSTILPALPYLNSGRIRALALTSQHRLKMLPDVPTADEAGLPHYEASVTYGIAAPAGTPREILGKLREQIAQVLNLPDVRGLLESQGMEVVAGTSDEYGRDIRMEVAKWAQIVKASGAKID